MSEAQIGVHLSETGHYGVHSYHCETHGDVGFVTTAPGCVMCAECYREMLGKKVVAEVKNDKKVRKVRGVLRKP